MEQGLVRGDGTNTLADLGRLPGPRPSEAWYTIFLQLLDATAMEENLCAEEEGRAVTAKPIKKMGKYQVQAGTRFGDISEAFCKGKYEKGRVVYTIPRLGAAPVNPTDYGKSCGELGVANEEDIMAMFGQVPAWMHGSDLEPPAGGKMGLWQSVTLPQGTNVVAVGLQAKPELNGKLGTVTGVQTADMPTGVNTRFSVTFGQSGTFALKRGNLQVVEEGSSKKKKGKGKGKGKGKKAKAKAAAAATPDEDDSDSDVDEENLSFGFVMFVVHAPEDERGEEGQRLRGQGGDAEGEAGKTHPHASMRELMDIQADRWNQISSEEREVWEATAVEHGWEANLTIVRREIIQAAEADAPDGLREVVLARAAGFPDADRARVLRGVTREPEKPKISKKDEDKVKKSLERLGIDSNEIQLDLGFFWFSIKLKLNHDIDDPAEARRRAALEWAMLSDSSRAEWAAEGAREAPRILAKACWSCNYSGPGLKMKKCSGCKEALYCSAECAKKHWKEHKKTCGKKA